MQIPRFIPQPLRFGSRPVDGDDRFEHALAMVTMGKKPEEPVLPRTIPGEPLRGDELFIAASAQKEGTPPHKPLSDNSLGLDLSYLDEWFAITGGIRVD